LPPSAASWRPREREAANAAFWARAERAAGNDAKIPAEPPWWLDRNPLFVAIDAPQPARTTPAAPQPAAQPKPEPTAPATPEDTWWLPAGKQ
jgi:hypothetical protein